MSEPHHLRTDRVPALEPWALDLLQQDSAETRSDPTAQDELARLVALLRSLPNPEPSPDLAQRVIEYVAAQQAQPRWARMAAALGRGIGSPVATFALAASVAGLLAIAISPSLFPSILHSGSTEPESALSPMPITRIAQSNTTQRRSAALVRPQFVSAVFAQAPAAVPRIHPDRAPLEEGFALGLDRQLNQLMIDPTAFAQRLERVPQRDLLIARLADRAAERGDAPAIALRVRQSPHPLATQLMDRLLRATLGIAPH